MATHGTPVGVPAAVPNTLPAVRRLTWDVGDRVTSDAPELDRWHHRTGNWSLTVYDPTQHTLVLRVRSPVGREHYYGAAKLDLDDVRSALTDAADWRRATN